MEPNRIILTDPPALPGRRKDDRCPRCKAGRDKREASSGFGASITDVCGVCGYEFSEGE